MKTTSTFFRKNKAAATGLALSALLFFAKNTASAQQTAESSPAPIGFKPAPGELGIGLQTAGIRQLVWDGGAGGAQAFALQIRRAHTPQLIFRADVNIDITSESFSEKNSFDSGGYDLMKESEKSTIIGLAPGIERHFAGTRRLDPYMGAALPIAFIGKLKTSETEEDVQADGDYFKWTVDETQPGGIGFGLNGFVGCNYYLADRFSIGVEYDFGLLFAKTGGELERKTTTRVKNGGGAEVVTTVESKGDEVSARSLFFGNIGMFGVNAAFYFGK